MGRGLLPSTISSTATESPVSGVTVTRTAPQTSLLDCAGSASKLRTDDASSTARKMRSNSHVRTDRDASSKEPHLAFTSHVLGIVRIVPLVVGPVHSPATAARAAASADGVAAGVGGGTDDGEVSVTAGIAGWVGRFG